MGHIAPMPKQREQTNKGEEQYTPSQEKQNSWLRYGPEYWPVVIGFILAIIIPIMGLIYTTIIRSKYHKDDERYKYVKAARIISIIFTVLSFLVVLPIIIFIVVSSSMM